MNARRPGRSLGPVLRGEGFRRSLFAAVGLACLSLYLWPALKGPVVLWSDSRIDLDWAARGAGIFGPAPPLPPGEDAAHPLKPGYLLFLRTAMALSPFEDARTVVVLQSLLLVLCVVAVSLHLARKRSYLVGVGFLFLFLLFLRTRNAASAVMPETITVVLLLACAAFLLEPPRRVGVFAVPGFLAGVLFSVRPNAGSIALALLVLRFLLSRHIRGTAMILAAFAVPFLTFWIATPAPNGHDATRGLSFSILEGSAEYYWRPSLGFPPAAVERRDSAEEIRLAAANWKRTLSTPGPDARRQLFWRAFHGFLGAEYYDARWSRSYHAANSAAMILAPFLILACVALCLALPFSGGERSLELLPAALLSALFFQNLLLGSNPRYVLPFLPVLFLLLLQGLPALIERGRGRIGLAIALFPLLLLLVFRQVGVLDVQWGQVEAAGVRLQQRISRGALPAVGPATLHFRIAPAALPAGAHLEVLAPGGVRLYDSRQDASRHLPAITIQIPSSLLEVNAAGSLTLDLVSSGQYGPHDYLLFPVVPPPWKSPAARLGSASLSPATGIRSGSLDWWAHPGLDPPPPR